MRWRALAAAGAACGLIGLLAYGGASLVRLWQMSRDVETLEGDVRTLRTETEDLTKRIDRLRTDPEAIEQLAREQLGLVKPGERVLKLPSTRGGR